jgi:Tfp pilus assembly protein PilN
MRKIQADLSSPSLRRTLYRTPRLVRALFFIVLVLVPPAVTNVAVYVADLKRYDAAVAARQVRQAPPAAVSPVVHQPQVPQEQAAAVNAAVMQLNLPWRALRDAVQATTPKNVALLAIEPDARKQVLRITAEAKTSDDMIGYVEQMKALDSFAAVALTRHEINEQDPNHPVRFQLDAQWRQP